MRFAAALFAAALLAALGSTTASAALKPGAAAPGFTARASLGGKEFDFSLSDALKKGPVVLYFYPAAFTPGCTQEAHEFAEAVEKFAALGASAIGVSATTSTCSPSSRSASAAASSPSPPTRKGHHGRL